MKYKGYDAVIYYDENGMIFSGSVIGAAEPLLFEGRSVQELEESFHEKVEAYLEACRKAGINPEKTFSGSFNVRISPELHRQAAVLAAKKGCSLNQLVMKAIESYLDTEESENEEENRSQSVDGGHDRRGTGFERRMQAYRDGIGAAER